MKKLIILPIASAIILILGLAIVFIPTEISVTLMGSVLMAGGVLGFIVYLLDRYSPKNRS